MHNKKPNYLLYFILSLIGILICFLILKKIELDNIQMQSIACVYAQVTDGKFNIKYGLE